MKRKTAVTKKEIINWLINNNIKKTTNIDTAFNLVKKDKLYSNKTASSDIKYSLKKIILDNL